MEKTKENKIWAADKIKRLESLRYSPKTLEGIDGVVDEVLNMLPSREIGDWLFAKIARTENEFPPPATMRSILSYTYRPADDPKRPHEIEQEEKAKALAEEKSSEV